MTKQEYLGKLQETLAKVMPEMLQEVMEDYQNHFELGVKNGKSEEQLCEELGDIDEFITELAQMEGIDLNARRTGQVEAPETPEAPKAPEAPETPEAPKAPEAPEAPETAETSEAEGQPSDAGQEMGEAEEGTWREAPDQEEASHRSQNERKSTNWTETFSDIQNTVSEALSGIQNNVQGILQQTGVQNLIHQGEEVFYQSGAIIQEKVQEYFKGPAFEGKSEKGGSEEQTQQEAEERRSAEKKNLVLEGLSAEVVVESSEDNSIQIHYENFGSVKQQMQYRFYFREEGDTIYAGIRKSRTAAGIFWGSFSPEMSLAVKLPAEAQMIELNTLSGSISMKGVQAKEFRINTASGNMKFYRIQADAMRSSTMSGDIQADQMEVRCLELQSKSGEVQADDIRGEAVLLKSMSGDVSVRHVDCQELSISSISGDSVGRNIKADQMACTSTSGDSEIQGEFVRCRVESVSGDATLTTSRDLEASISSVSGDVRLNLSNENRGFDVNYQTVSGELEVRYGGEHQYLTRNGRLEKGEKASRIYLKTVSGDMVISD